MGISEGKDPGRTSATSRNEDDLVLRRRLEWAVRRVCPAWLAGQAQDLVQSAMLRIVTRRSKTEGNPDFSWSYLEKTAYSAVVDELWRERRRRKVHVQDETAVSVARAAQPRPDQQTAATEIRRGIRACLGELVPPRRRAVALYLLGHSVPESGRLLGWSTKRTENLVYRGLQNLRRCLASRGLKW